MVEIIVNGEVLDRKAAGKWLSQPPGTIQGRKKYELIMELFWAAFPWRSCENVQCVEKHRCFLGCLPKQKKMEMLRAASQLVITKTRRAIRIKSVREYFNAHRDEQDDRPCWVCGARFNHRHHVIQIQHGGLNRGINIVLLCKACHRDVHRPS